MNPSNLFHKEGTTRANKFYKKYGFVDRKIVFLLSEENTKRQVNKDLKNKR